MNKTTQPADYTLVNLQLLSTQEFQISKFFDKMYTTGRPRKMNYSMIIDSLTLKTKYSCENWYGIYRCLKDNRQSWKLPNYPNFLKTIKLFTRFLFDMLNKLLNLNYLDFIKKTDKIAFVDSTSLPVCKVIRSSRHKTMKNTANYSKSTTGWYYGFKEHLICDWQTKRVIKIEFSKANQDDRIFLAKTLKSNLFYMTGTMFVADKGYQAKWLQDLAVQTGNYLLTGIKSSKNQKTLASQFDIYLLHNRAKIETLFSNLKTNYNLVNTRSRSVLGYVFNYIFSNFSLISGQR